MTRAPALRVPVQEGERVRRALLEEGALRTDLKVRKEGGELLLPMMDETSRLGFPVAQAEFEEIDSGPKSYQDLLKHLPASVRALLPTSFDIIGEVLLVKIPEPLGPHAEEIAQALLKATPRIRTVAHDEGVGGELRVRSLRVIAGEPETATEHVEYGVRLRVDPATCYFSPRLSTERYRVAKLVQPGERVVDLMAGVAPFAIVIAKHSEASRIDAIDLNEAATRFARENVRLNKVEERVVVEHADARRWAAAHEGVADRVVTNLPHTAHAFLDEALEVLKPEGGVWHYHCIQSEDGLGRHMAELAERAHDAGRELEVLSTRVVRAYSPKERHYAVDFAVRPRE